ncbi:MAG: class I SAM-dependent methyltransferase [Nanoarchaeota archaeon]|nr:class I SAM-dependent methyltransferase [Nanoarchaeota archaeon]
MLSYGNVEFSGKKILDIGCHLGLFSNLLASLKHDSADVYGLDFTEDFIKIAKKTNPGINYVQGNVYELPFEKEFFDLVLCNYVFNAIPLADLSKVAVEISGKVKPGGYILFFDFYDSPTINFLNKTFRGSTRKKEKHSTYDDEKLNFLFSDFKVVKSKTMMNVLRTKLLIGRKTPYWLMGFLDQILPNYYYLALLQKKS